jgi:hypothetical protein
MGTVTLSNRPFRRDRADHVNGSGREQMSVIQLFLGIVHESPVAENSLWQWYATTWCIGSGTEKRENACFDPRETRSGSLGSVSGTTYIHLPGKVATGTIELSDVR